MPRGGRTLTLTVALGAALAAAPGASADSIVYEKGGNIWQANPDGSDQRQITTSGGFTRPTQSDDGTIVAVKNRLLQRMDRGGTILNTAGDPGNGNQTGPITPQLSPNGQRVAYSYNDTGPGTPGLHATLSFASRETDHDELFTISGRANTSWAGSDRVVLFDTAPYDQDTLVYTLGSPGTTTWYDDPTLDAVGGDVQAGNGRYAATDGPILRLYTLSGPPPTGTPTPECDLTGPSGAFFRPTWAPSGGGIAWQEDDGIWMGRFDLATCDEIEAARVVIPGGRSPDWGPANVSTPVSSSAPADGAPPAGATMGTAAPSLPPAGSGVVGRLRIFAVTLGQRSTLRRVLAGLTVPVSCIEACSITAELIVDRQTARRLRLPRGSLRLARATKRLTRAGSDSLRLRPGSRLRSRMRRARPRQVSVRVSATDVAGTRSAPTIRTLRLR